MPVTIYKRGEIWHYRGTVAGRRIRGSTGAADKKIAQRIAAEREAREWKRHLDGPEAVLTFAQAAILYRSAGKPTRHLEKVEDHWKDTPVREINAGAIRQAARTLYPGCSASTWNRQVIVPTQAIINHAAENNLCSPIKVKRFEVDRREKEPATWEWIEAFMAHAPVNLGALACFMFLTGARIGEATALTWDDVDLPNARAVIRQTKVGAERRAHLPPALVAAMANIAGRDQRYNSKPDNGRVFGYTSRSTAKPMWDKTIRKAGIRHLSFHACRHGFATALLRAGIDVVTIARLGGWASPQHVLSTYGHAAEDDTLANRIIGAPQTQPTQKRKKWKS